MSVTISITEEEYSEIFNSFASLEDLVQSCDNQDLVNHIESGGKVRVSVITKIKKAHYRKIAKSALDKTGREWNKKHLDGVALELEKDDHFLSSRAKYEA